MKTSLLLTSCLTLAVAATSVQAASLWWDPTGTTNSATPNGTWEKNAWATSSALQASPGPWVEGDFARFSAGSAATGAYTVTMNATHTVDGFYLITGTTLTITGPGPMLFPGAQGIIENSSTQNIFVYTPIGDVPGNPGIVVPDGSGSLYLYATNTFSGGIQCNSGALNFTNSAAFGTGPISFFTATTYGILADLAPTNSPPMNITNELDFTGTANHMIIVGTNNGASMTWSGPWTVAPGTQVLTYQGGQAFAGAPPLNITGQITGSGVLSIVPTSQVSLNGPNMHSGGTTLAGPGIINFNTNDATAGYCLSFGSGALTIASGGGALVSEGNQYVIVPNPMVVSVDGTLNIVPGAGGAEFSGGISLSETNAGFTLGTGPGAGSNLVISGSISGTGNFNADHVGNLVLTAAESFSGSFSNSCPVIFSNGGSLGLGNTFLANVTNNGSITYLTAASQTFGEPIAGTGNIIMDSPGNTMYFQAANTYSGLTIIRNGTILLQNSGSINSTAAISISANGTLDVSAVDPFVLPASATLYASGLSTTTNNAALINDSGSTGVNLGSQPIDLTIKPSSSSGDANHAALVVTAASLTFNGNVITVTNASASPLGAGVYTLIKEIGGTIVGTPASTAVIGGVGSGIGTISVSNNSVVLTVTSSGSYPSPVITGVHIMGSTLTLSATNGTPNGPYKLVSTTNLLIPETNWTVVTNGTFDSSGNLNLTNLISTNTSPQFFSIQNP
jgi:autotransporter-associated beta strand protein